MDNFLSVLKNSWLFHSKSEAEIKILLSSIKQKVVDYRKGNLLFSAQSQAEFLGIVLQGSVIIEKCFPDGKTITILHLSSSEIFGEFIIFSKKQLYPVDILAAENCKVLLIHKQAFLKLLASDTEILSSFLEAVATRMMKLHKKIEILSLGSIPKKIAYFLLAEATLQKSTKVIQLPFSKTSWSEQMGISRPSLSRELRNLSLKGLLSFDKKTIIIEDLAGLQRLLL